MAHPKLGEVHRRLSACSHSWTHDRLTRLLFLFLSSSSLAAHLLAFQDSTRPARPTSRRIRVSSSSDSAQLRQVETHKA
jgi:hypothetical protein